MSDPQRLLGGAGTDVERGLLEAAAAEEPPADGAARLAAALGLIGGAPSPRMAAAEAPGAVAKVGGVKLALFGLTLLGAASGAWWWTVSGRTSVAPRAREVTAAPSALPSESSPRPGTAARDRSTREPGHADPSVSALADEIARLDAVRSALARNQARAALTLLEGYAEAHPRGSLAPEALRLRVEALLGARALREAKSEAQRFLRMYPNSPHADALRTVVRGRRDAESPR